MRLNGHFFFVLLFLDLSMIFHTVNPSVFLWNTFFPWLLRDHSPDFPPTSLATIYSSPVILNTLQVLTEKAMAPHSSTFAWKIPWVEEPGRLQSMGSLESDTTEWLHFHFSLSCIGEGNGNPLQSSCLENPRDGGAWWAAVYGVAQSRTRLKRLSSSSNA